MLPAYFPKSLKGPEFDTLKFNNLQIVPYSRLPSLIDSGKLDDAQIDGC
jgi:hypothetical protein